MDNLNGGGDPNAQQQQQQVADPNAQQGGPVNGVTDPNAQQQQQQGGPDWSAFTTAPTADPNAQQQQGGGPNAQQQQQGGDPNAQQQQQQVEHVYTRGETGYTAEQLDQYIEAHEQYQSGAGNLQRVSTEIAAMAPQFEMQQKMFEDAAVQVDHQIAQATAIANAPAPQLPPNYNALTPEQKVQVQEHMNRANTQRANAQQALGRLQEYKEQLSANDFPAPLELSLRAVSADPVLGPMFANEQKATETLTGVLDMMQRVAPGVARQDLEAELATVTPTVLRALLAKTGGGQQQGGLPTRDPRTGKFVNTGQQSVRPGGGQQQGQVNAGTMQDRVAYVQKLKTAGKELSQADATTFINSPGVFASQVRRGQRAPLPRV